MNNAITELKHSPNPAEEAAAESLKKVFEAIKNNKSFRLEAGAGAGKTYSLIKALKYLIDDRGRVLHKENKRIACITYTEVARDQIRSRIDNHPVVLVETIHAFSWSLIKHFQKPIRELIPLLGDKWIERLSESEGIFNQPVIYNLGYPKITKDEIYLHHDDVIKLITFLLDDAKFKSLLSGRFPIILIDEYQDTNKNLAAALVRNFIEPETGPLIGLFGDHWQKIYDSASCGLITASENKLEVIGKNANFRSDRLIVESLNKMRPELPQNSFDPTSTGQISVFHSNNWIGTRQTANHWQGDLPEPVAHQYLNATKIQLEQRGWIFTRDYTKILMLTNNVLATEQGYRGITRVFPFSDDYLKKGDRYIEFFADVLEPGCHFFQLGKFGEMFKAFNLKTTKINKHSEKSEWNRDMKLLLDSRNNNTVGEVIELLKATQKPRLSARIEESETRLGKILSLKEDELTEEDKQFKGQLMAFKAISYQEVISLVAYVDDKTPFSTKHGVKGAEFENVLVVCGRGWNHYDWNQMLTWIATGVPAGRQETFERNRNLFYVATSRPKKRLALLFTQELTSTALTTLSNWYGAENITPLPI